VARDRRGDVITQASGTSSILPQQAIQLAQVNVKPPAQTALGPILVELRLKDKSGKILAERLHVFGSDNTFVGRSTDYFEIRAPMAMTIR
jgi:hypothetical protein